MHDYYHCLECRREWKCLPLNGSAYCLHCGIPATIGRLPTKHLGDILRPHCIPNEKDNTMDTEERLYSISMGCYNKIVGVKFLRAVFLGIGLKEAVDLWETLFFDRVKDNCESSDNTHNPGDFKNNLIVTEKQMANFFIVYHTQQYQSYICITNVKEFIPPKQDYVRMDAFDHSRGD